MLKTNSVLSVRIATFLCSLLVIAIIASGCGKKEESTTSTDKKDTKTTETKTTDTKTTDTKSSGDKKELKKSDAPKKDITEKAPEDWTALESGDGRVQFSLPSKWTVEENSATKFVTLSEDKTMGTNLVTFSNDQITSDELLAAALADFDFQPEGEANAIVLDGIEGYMSVAKGNINGQDMMMYIMSAVEPEGKGNYVIYIYTPTEMFEKNSPTLEKILHSIDFKAGA